MLFDNKTKDEGKKASQVQQLLSLVNKVTAQNGGQPYTDEIFAEVKVITFHICYLFGNRRHSFHMSRNLATMFLVKALDYFLIVIII